MSMKNSLLYIASQDTATCVAELPFNTYFPGM